MGRPSTPFKIAGKHVKNSDAHTTATNITVVNIKIYLTHLKTSYITTIKVGVVT